MASMELTPEQSKEEGAELSEYRPRWAVSPLYLGDEALKALGITEPLKPGSMVMIMAQAKVVSAELREDQQGESENCMSVQIVEMTLAPAAKDARAMYPKSKMEA
jgi:ABC-type molybdate transport system ATPase subunit